MPVRIRDDGTKAVVIAVIMSREKADEKDTRMKPKLDGEGNPVIDDKTKQHVLEPDPMTEEERTNWYLQHAENELRDARTAMAVPTDKLNEEKAAEVAKVNERYTRMAANRPTRVDNID